MDNDPPNNPTAPARSGQATDYATEVVDAALRHVELLTETSDTDLELMEAAMRAEEKHYTCHADTLSNRILAAEVRRLNRANKIMREALLRIARRDYHDSVHREMESAWELAESALRKSELTDAPTKTQTNKETQNG